MSTNRLTPQDIISSGEAHPGECIVFDANMKVGSGQKTLYYPFKWRKADGALVSLNLSLAFQLLGGTAKCGNGDPKTATATQMIFRKVTQEMLDRSSHSPKNHKALLHNNELLMDALQVINDEFTAAADPSVVVKGKRKRSRLEVATRTATLRASKGAPVSMTPNKKGLFGIIQSERKIDEKKSGDLSGDEIAYLKRTYPNEFTDDGDEPTWSDMRLPVEPIARMKVRGTEPGGPILRSFGSGDSREYNHVVFDSRASAKLTKAHRAKNGPSAKAKRVPATVKGQQLTIQNADKVLTYMSVIIAGEWRIEGMMSHTYGVSLNAAVYMVVVRTEKRTSNDEVTADEEATAAMFADDDDDDDSDGEDETAAAPEAVNPDEEEVGSEDDLTNGAGDVLVDAV